MAEEIGDTPPVLLLKLLWVKFCLVHERSGLLGTGEALLKKVVPLLCMFAAASEAAGTRARSVRHYFLFLA